MAITLVDHTQADATTTTGAINSTGATLLVCVMHYYHAGTFSVSDSKGNTWHSLTTRGQEATGAGFCQIFYAYDHGGSALSVGSNHTFTISSTEYQSATVTAWSGTGTTSAVFDKENGNYTTSNGYTIQLNSVTPAVDNSLVIAAVSDGYSTTAQPSVNGSFTIIESVHSGNGMSGNHAYLIQTTKAAANPTFTYGVQWIWEAAIAVFAPASGAVAPTVTTTTPDHVGSVDALSGGNVTSDGGATITARGVCWSTSANPTTADDHTSESGTTGSFTSQATGLSPNTGYHIRAYATNSVGTSYGADDQITTTRYRVIPTGTMDSMLGVLSAATRLFICSAQPSTYAEASTTYNLATQTLIGGDFSLAAGDTSGRKLTLAQKTGISVSTGGTALYYALGIASGSTLLVVGSVTSQALTQGGTFTFPATDVDEIRDWS